MFSPNFLIIQVSEHLELSEDKVNHYMGTQVVKSRKSQWNGCTIEFPDNWMSLNKRNFFRPTEYLHDTFKP